MKNLLIGFVVGGIVVEALDVYLIYKMFGVNLYKAVIEVFKQK